MAKATTKLDDADEKKAAKPKAAAKPKVAPKAAPKVKAAAKAPGESASGDGKGLRIKSLMERIEGQTEVSKKDARAVTEAVLSTLGAAIAAGEGVTLPGFGRLKLVKRNTAGSAEVLTLKLRRIPVSEE